MAANRVTGVQLPECIVIDFEGYPIRPMPNYPPEPVGVSILWPQDADPTYWRWGHKGGGNNCDRSAAMFELEQAWNSGLPLLFHHGKFDVAVAIVKCGMKPKNWDDYHDTMYLSFLADPHNRSLSLKDLAHDFLEWPPEERDAVAEWIGIHKAELEATYGGEVALKKGCATPTASEPWEWFWAVPGDVLEPYANGDTRRTRALFQHLWPLIQENGMGEAYDRERRCMPIFMENELQGMRVDVPGLTRDTEALGSWFEYVEQLIRWNLKATGLNLDADKEVAKVLLDRGVVPKENWVLTKTGQLSVAKDNLTPEMFTGGSGDWTGAQIAAAMGYRNRLATCLRMFMEPWLAQALVNKGYITTSWNQTRGYDGGTRSGRPSTSKHNFLNLSKNFEGRDDGYKHPDFIRAGSDDESAPPLPLVRRYVLPDEGAVFNHRDFDGQEMRVFGHVECGSLQEQYRIDPKTDPHSFVGTELMRVVGREIERTKVKSLNFQGLYGGGVPALQRKLRCSLAEAKDLKRFHDLALPGRKTVVGVIKSLVGRGDPIRTWGGRVYFCEPPGPDGRSKDYKLINYYCQGSAADLTKEALATWYYGGAKSRFLVTVYDEINMSTLLDARAAEEMAWLREAMEQKRLCIAMLTSGKRGPNWGTLEKCE